MLPPLPEANCIPTQKLATMGGEETSFLHGWPPSAAVRWGWQLGQPRALGGRLGDTGLSLRCHQLQQRLWEAWAFQLCYNF